MKKKIGIFIVLFFLFCFAVSIFGQDDKLVEIPAVEEEKTVEEKDEGVSFGSGLWTFLNSPLGVSVVAFILSILVGKVFTAKPKWKSYVLKYGPSLMQAVKTAEKKIPDGTDNKGLSRLDEGLKYLLELEPKLKGAMESDLKQALTAVHASAEKNGNLKKS
jgi:hypothetical protein